jgi:thiol-disulfide isomerase/thioredoxin
MEHYGYSDCRVEGPTTAALNGHSLISQYFSADWCPPCSAFTPVLEKLYMAQKACRAKQLEVVLVSQCREAKATKYYHENMPWLSMWHDADDEMGMEASTSALMAKYGITSIPALVLLNKHGGVIYADARDKCVVDPEGWAFLWRQQSRFPQAVEMEVAEAMSQAAKQGPVVQFNLPPRARPLKEPLCAKPQGFSQGGTVGVPVRSQVRTPGGQATTTTRSAALGFPVEFPVGKRFGPSITMGTGTPTPQPSIDTHGRAQAKPEAGRKGKRKAPPPDEVGGPPPPPKPNFGVFPSPNGQMSAPTEGKPTSHMQPQPLADVHPFTLTLKEWRHGIEEDCGPDWTWGVIKAAVAQGPHPTACTPKAIALFKEDIGYQR